MPVLFLNLEVLNFNSLATMLNSDLELYPCSISPPLPPSSTSLFLNRVSALGLNLKWHSISNELSELCLVACQVSVWKQLYSIQVLNSSWKQPDIRRTGHGFCGQADLSWNYSIGYYSVVVSTVKRGYLQKIAFLPSSFIFFTHQISPFCQALCYAMGQGKGLVRKWSIKHHLTLGECVVW